MQIIRQRSSHFTLDILYLMLVVLGGYFWQERIINQDNAFLAFNITAFETFEIAHYRFTDMFSQIIPILFTKAGMSLPTILLSYSMSMLLVPYLFFRLVLYRFNEKGIAWMMFLVQLLFVSEYFFDAVSETKSAFAYTLTFVAILKNEKTFRNSIVYYSTAILLLILSILTHPVSLILLTILLFWVYINKMAPMKNTVILAGTTLVLIGLKSILLPTSGYENSLLSHGLNPSNWAEIMQENYVLQFMQQHFKRMYLYGLLFFLLFLFRYLKFNEKSKAFWYGILNIAMLFVICILFHKGDSTMMMEKNISVLSITILLPFIATPEEKTYALNSRRIKFFLPFLCLFFIHRIKNDSSYFVDRLEKMENLIDQGRALGHKKYFVHNTYLEDYPEINKWTLAEETALLSSLRGPQYSLSFKNITEVEYWRGTHENKHALIGPDFFMPYDTRKFQSKLYDFGEEAYVLLQEDN